MFKKRPYPMRSHYLMVDKRASTDDQVVIRSIVDEDERTSLPKEAAIALFRLDGYTPEKKAFRGFTEEERASWLEYFEEEDLLQWRKPIESLGAGNVLWAWYISTTPLSKKTSACFVFDAPFILEDDRKSGGVQPRRNYRGFRYNNGYSDHLPLVAHFDL